MKEAVENSRFLRLLEEFYDGCVDKGSVWLTIKQVPGQDAGGAPIKLCLVRAKIDKRNDRNSIHTFVKPHNVVSFSEDLNMLMNEKCSF